MLTYRINRGLDLLIYSLHEALTAAGTSELDSVWHQDQALESFFQGCRVQRLTWNPDSYDHDLALAVKNGVQVLIVNKENP